MINIKLGDGGQEEPRFYKGRTVQKTGLNGEPSIKSG